MMLLKLSASGMFVLAASSQTLEQAKRAFDAQQYAAAAQMFEQVRQKDPACDISFYLGITRYRLHQVDRALIAFQEAVKCDPKLTSAYIALGEGYAERGNDVAALAAYERALELEPDNLAALRGTAALYLRTKRNDHAAAVLERLVRHEPTDAQVHADLGAAYFGASNQEGAEREFAEALRLKPGLAAAMLGKANLLLRKGEDEQALRLLREVVLLSPNAIEPHFVLGSTFNHLSRFAEAVTELDTAVRLGGSESEIQYQLARAYGGLGLDKERSAALKNFTELRKRSNADAEARRQAFRLVEQAKPYVESGDLREALAKMKQARELCPHEETILFRLASLEYDLADYAEAQRAIQEAIALAPSQWVYHLLLGLIDGRSGKLADAQSSLGVALRLNPSAADAHNALGEILLRQGKPADAIASFQKAMELKPGEAAYRQNLENAKKASVK